MIGRLLDQRYQVVEILGQGGFGHTYIAQDTRRPGNPTCVVKQLKPATSDTEFLRTARRLFNNEAETLEKLGKHDQIPQLLAYFELDEEFFLVQEYIPGHPLSKEITPGTRWETERVIQLLAEVLPILEFVHNNGVIHRDIKPDNIIRRSSDNKLVLVDFGAVKQVKMPSLMTQELQNNETVAIGTPGYMPSEQGQGRPRPSSDIYALGMIAIQALTGLNPTQLPEDPTTGEILWQHYAQTSQQLTAILSKMVRHYFKYRFQTANDALQAINTIANTNTPKVLVGVLQQKGQQYIKQAYVQTILVLQSFQETIKTINIAPKNLNSGASTPTITLPLAKRNSATHNTVTVAYNNLPKPSPASQSSNDIVIKIPYKSKRFITTSFAIIIGIGGLIAASRPPQTSIINTQNQAQINTTNTNIKQNQIEASKPQQKQPQEILPAQTQPQENKPEQKNNNCLVVTRSSNLRSLSRRGRTGTVIKAGTKVITTGKEDDGWIEISAPEQGWIWKSRTKNICQSE